MLQVPVYINDHAARSWKADKALRRLYITFIDKDDMEHKLAVSAGDNLLDIAQAHDLEMEGKP